jgi:hypothetical protein
VVIGVDLFDTMLVGERCALSIPTAAGCHDRSVMGLKNR